MLHEKGLAYQAEAEVNYDPIDKTVLANEQVDANGCSWRSGAKVEKKMLKQWFFRISDFREALLKGLDVLDKDGAWPERVLTMQKNWLGKSIGACATKSRMAAQPVRRRPASTSPMAPTIAWWTRAMSTLPSGRVRRVVVLVRFRYQTMSAAPQARW